MARTVLVLLFSALALGAQLVYTKFFFASLILDMYTNCKNFTIPIVGEIKDAYYANGVGVILRSDKVEVYQVLGKDRDEWKTLLEKEVGWDFEEVATDGKRVYLCGDVCKALNLRGEELWEVPISFNGNRASVAVLGKLLIVPNEERGEVYFVSEGRVVKSVRKRFESIDFCGNYYALIINKTLEVGKVPSMKVLWKREGAWSPYKVKFSADCSAVGVNTLTSIYVYKTSSGEKVDVVDASGGIFTAFSVCRIGGVWTVIAVNAPYSAISSPFEEHLQTLEGYVLGR